MQTFPNVKQTPRIISMDRCSAFPVGNNIRHQIAETEGAVSYHSYQPTLIRLS